MAQVDQTSEVGKAITNAPPLSHLRTQKAWIAWSIAMNVVL